MSRFVSRFRFRVFRFGFIRFRLFRFMMFGFRMFGIFRIFGIFRMFRGRLFAFSLIEVMVALLVVAIIVAALAPVLGGVGYRQVVVLCFLRGIVGCVILILKVV